MTGVERRAFGRTAAGREVDAFALEGGGGLRAVVMARGATLVELLVPDHRGERADVVLGFDDLAGYESAENPYFGCTVGRCANRIRRGRFELDGVEHALSINEPPNHLHGGEGGFDKRVWRAEVLAGEAPAVRFSRTSPDGEEGYPGELSASVTYSIPRAGELWIEYRASCDRSAPVSLTHHSYFNLAGSESVLGHELSIQADRYTPTDGELIPTGAIEPVAGTPLDFRRPKPVGRDVGALEGTPALGYDHNFALRPGDGSPSLAARLRDPASGRVLELLTTEPGLQLYTGNRLDGLPGKGGRTYERNAALCLEAQDFPDSVNCPGFPRVILELGEFYSQTTVHRFSAGRPGDAIGSR